MHLGWLMTVYWPVEGPTLTLTLSLPGRGNNGKLHGLFGDQGGLLCPRMGLIVDFAQAVGRQVGVDLRRGDIGMAQELLHRA